MYRNIPVVSYVLQRGRASCCGARIPAWYAVAEGGTVGGAVIGGWMAGWPIGLAGTAVAVLATATWHRHRSRQRIRSER